MATRRGREAGWKPGTPTEQAPERTADALAETGEQSALPGDRAPTPPQDRSGGKLKAEVQVRGGRVVHLEQVEEPLSDRAPLGEAEPLEPGGETGETREVGKGGSVLRQPGRAPLSRVQMHRPGGGASKGDHEE